MRSLPSLFRTDDSPAGRASELRQSRNVELRCLFVEGIECRRARESLWCVRQPTHADAQARFGAGLLLGIPTRSASERNGRGTRACAFGLVSAVFREAGIRWGTRTWTGHAPKVDTLAGFL